MSEETEISEVDEVAALLSEVAEIHAMVFRITDDEDADWASWYAKWLLELSEFPDLMGEDIPLSHLIYELVRLDREYTETEPEEPWELYYAERLIDAFETIDLLDEEEDDEDGDEEEASDDDGEDFDDDSEDLETAEFEEDAKL